MTINLGIVYALLKSTNCLESKLGKVGLVVLRRIFGIILLSIAIKIFKVALFTGEI